MILDPKKIWIVLGGITLMFFIPFLVYVSCIEECEQPFEKCDYLAAKLEKNRQVIFCLNETTSFLQSVNIYDCNKISRLSLFDTFEIFKAFKTYFDDEKGASKNANAYNTKTCPYLLHEYLIKFCFDHDRLISNMIVFDKFTMNPQEAYHLYIYLKVFLK